MLTNSQETPADGRYEAVIALMQTYDCSYEEAERHLQELGSFQEGEEMQPGGELQGGVHEDGEALGAGESIVRFTPKQVRALGGFFNGTLIHFKSHRRLTLCQKFTAKVRTLKKKVKCLKHLHPKRLWRALRRRQSATYKKIASADLNTTIGQHAKGAHERSSEQWTEPDTDWEDELENIGEELSMYLGSHRELVREVKGLSNEGVRVALPDPMPLPPTLRPFLFLREKAADSIAENVKLVAEKAFRVVCVDREQFVRLFGSSPDESLGISLAAYNIFQELQVLSQYRAFVEQDVKAGEKLFREFLIKNRLFKCILQRDLEEVAFAHEQQGSSEDEEEGQRRDIEAHQSIIREQDMLYQSMLSAYTAREAERETEIQEADQSIVHLQKEKQALRLTIREEPSPSPETLHLSFRTPNGSVLTRNFHRSDSLQYVKDWISVEDQVEFEDTKGTFDLYHGYPPTLLESAPNSTLASLFGAQEKVRLIIREN